MSTIIQARLSEEENAIVTQYIKTKNISMSDLIRNAIMERIEDEIDLKLYKEAMEEFEKNPVTYTHEEVAKMLGIENV